MSNDKETGGAAFPPFHNPKTHPSGMSLRDYFAAHCPITFSEFLNGWKKTDEASGIEALEAFAEFRIDYADSMLKARNQEPPQQKEQPHV